MARRFFCAPLEHKKRREREEAQLQRTCPGCDSATPGEWDEVLQVFVCATCLRQ